MDARLLRADLFESVRRLRESDAELDANPSRGSLLLSAAAGARRLSGIQRSVGATVADRRALRAAAVRRPERSSGSEHDGASRSPEDTLYSKMVVLGIERG